MRVGFYNVVVKELQVAYINAIAIISVDPEYVPIVDQKIVGDRIIKRLCSCGAAKFHKTQVLTASIIHDPVITNRTIHFNSAAIYLVIVAVAITIMDLIIGNGI